MPTLDSLLNPADFDLGRLLEELANEPGGFRTEQLERARTNLIDFSQFIDPSFEVNWHHALIAEQLEAVATGAVSKLMVLCPPRHGKTVLCSHHFPAWLLARQDEAVVGCAYNSTKAIEEAATVQRIMCSERYRVLFPSVQLPQRSNAQTGQRVGADKFTLLDRPRANYRAVGIGKGLTGFDKTIGLIDDPVKDRVEALSETWRNRVWDWYSSVYKFRDTEVIAGPRGIRDVLIMTPWHEDDLHGRLLENERGQWAELRLSAYLTDETWPLRHPLDPRQPMEALWPKAKRIDQLIELQQKRPDVFQALFQCRPSNAGGSLFRKDHFRNRFRLGELGRHEGHWLIGVDAAFKAEATSSRVSIQVWCIDYEQCRAYLAHSTSRHRTFTETVNDIRSALKIWPQCTELMIEEKANGSAIIDVLRKQVGQIITPYNPKGGKIARAAAVSHFVEALCVWVPDSAPWLEDFFAEVLPFPRGKFNDAADVLSMVLTKLANSDLAGQDVWDEFVGGRL